MDVRSNRLNKAAFSNSSAVDDSSDVELSNINYEIYTIFNTNNIFVGICSNQTAWPAAKIFTGWKKYSSLHFAKSICWDVSLDTLCSWKLTASSNFAVGKMLFRTDNVRGQISGDIFVPNEGHFLISISLGTLCIMTFDFRFSEFLFFIFSPKLKALFGQILTMQR